MAATKQGDSLIRLVRYGIMNYYLVREADGFTLVDTGMSGGTPGILAAARRLGAPIVRIVLTHAHVDHVGSLDALHTALPAAEVAIGARDARFLAGDLSLDPGEPQTKLRGGYPVCTTRPDRLLMPGDQIGSLEVIATPGHTPGHIALLDRRDRTVIAGDAFQTLGGIAVSGIMRPLFPLPALATWHPPTALSSARALRDLRPSRLAVGHGRILADPLTAMDQAITVATRRLAAAEAHAQ